MLNIKKNTEQLRTLILERQKFESENKKSPYSTFPTDFNFRDINGYALIHYASYQNNIELIKTLILEKADVNAKTQAGVSPLEIALFKGNIEVAEILVANSAATENILLYKISDLKCRQWFRAILSKNPVKTKSQEWVGFFSLSLDDKINLLVHEANLNNIDYIKCNLKKLLDKAQNKEKIFYVLGKVSDIACCSGYLDIVKFLYELFPEYYQQENFLNGPLHQAIVFKQSEIINFLWDKVKIFAKDINNLNIFLCALGVVNNELAGKIYNENNIDVCATDIFGNNAIIYAVLAENIDMLNTLLSSPHKEKLLQQVNIYGENAKDLAQYSQSHIIRKLFNIDETIAKKEPYSYAQMDLNPRINYFLRMNYLDIQIYWDSEGMCTGYAPYFLMYAAAENLNFYRERLDFFSQWDGSRSFLEQQVNVHSKISSSDKIYDLLIGLAYGIIWFQHGRELNAITHIKQSNRTVQFKGTNFSAIPKIFLKFKKFNDFSYEELKNNLSELSNVPPGCCIELSSNKHVVPIYIKSTSEIYYGDSNHPKLIRPFNSIEKCVEFFYQTVLLKEHLLDPCRPFGFKIIAYYFPEFELSKLPSQKFEEIGKEKEIINYFAIGILINDFEFIKIVISKIPKIYLCAEKNGISVALLNSAFPNREVLDLLLEAGLNINQITQDGNTLLHTAITKENLDLFCYLINHGASFSIKDEKGKSALDLLATASEEFQVQYARCQGLRMKNF